MFQSSCHRERSGGFATRSSRGVEGSLCFRFAVEDSQTRLSRSTCCSEMSGSFDSTSPFAKRMDWLRSDDTTGFSAAASDDLPMSVESIRRFCLSFPHATENLQWGDDLCFKVGGKIFALVSLGSVPQRLMFKCTPETFAELVEQEDIVPAPYVGRYKWVSLERLDVLPWGEMKDLIQQSYEMVAAKARIASTNSVRSKATQRGGPRARGTGK
jgi:predicted DNA-binding protein (MmcQ/YjbR family)